MRLLAVEKRVAGDWVRLSGWLKHADSAGEEEIYFAFPAEFAPLVAEHADAFVPALLVPAMMQGVPLELAPPISRRLWSQLSRIQEILADWFSDALCTVPVHARELREPLQEHSELTGAFFSLGVDSFHTLLRHENDVPQREKITHLIFMTGFEASLAKSRDGRVRPIVERVQQVARRLGKRAICGETNLRDRFPLAHWGPYYHGAGLASAALALSGGLGRVLIPSSFAWRHIMPWASSPVVDPLWSNDDLEILHDGTGVDRSRKVVDTLLQYPEVATELRVCTKAGRFLGNCGVCSKCTRTMITLEIAGALRTSGAFPRDLPRDFWRYLEVKRSGVPFEEDNLRLARERDAEAWIVAGLERAVRIGRLEVLRRQEGTRRLVKGLGEFAWERTAGRALRRLRAKRLKAARRLFRESAPH